MEFDNNTPASDEQRRLAEAKKITIQPVHTDIQPDDLPDTEIATRHVLEPAIPNVSTDVEQNTTPIAPSAGVLKRETTPPRRRITLTLVGICLIGIAITGMLLTR